jgi:SsrA-binding protein
MSDVRVVAKNKKATFNYNILDKIIAGVVLKGYEVKSAVSGNISLKESFVRVAKGEVWLINAHISRWKYANISDYNPTVQRKLLLNKREIKKLQVAQDVKKLSIVPLEVLVARGKVKVKIGVGKSRKKYDKRAVKKQKEMERQVREDLANVKKF